MPDFLLLYSTELLAARGGLRRLTTLLRLTAHVDLDLTIVGAHVSPHLLCPRLVGSCILRLHLLYSSPFGGRVLRLLHLHGALGRLLVARRHPKKTLLRRCMLQTLSSSSASSLLPLMRWTRWM
jgi:hypothetical protein